MADDGIQREVEGGDHRLLLRLDHRGQQPPVDPAARDRGRRQDLSGRVVERLRQSPQGLHPRRGGGGTPDPSEVHPLATEAASNSSTRPHPARRDLIPVHCRGDGARGRAEPPPRPGGAARPRLGQSRWPPADANPSRRQPELAGPRAPCRARPTASSNSPVMNSWLTGCFGRFSVTWLFSAACEPSASRRDQWACRLDEPC